ncbi:hypothetical protein MW887_004415 [Aspergillus wentii]|nr:hypothetical protein MW887_004415 [Aspergillus wentii]
MLGTKRKHDETREIRTRASLACDTCRRQKEKCEGGQPCWRCERLGRPCHFQQPPNRPSFDERIVRKESKTNNVPKDNGRRVAKLEYIVRHFLGDVPLDEKNIARIIDQMEVPSKDDPEQDEITEESFDVRFVSKNTAHYSGEFSHWNFSQKLHNKMNCQIDRLNKNTSSRGTGLIKDYWRPTQLQSHSNIISDAVDQLPPRPVAEFLVSIFFEYVQLNCFYTEESWIKEKLDVCYNPRAEYVATDISWVCAVFSVLAIGIQVAHMEENKKEEHSDAVSESATACEDSVGLAFYRIASGMVPDVIAIASHESVQACLLLATYTLPISTGGLAYTYLGLAIKMSVLNGMHRQYVGRECDDRTIELRNRLFWTAHSLERNISIMHGRPGSIASSDISVQLPHLSPSFESPNFANMMAYIQLTSWLARVAETLSQLRKCPRRLVSDYLARTIRLRTTIRQWWDSLPEDIECRDMNPQGPLFRHNSHLKLCYLLIFIYMGRPFIFYHNEHKRDSTVQESTIDSSGGNQTSRSTLTEDCVQSALVIIDALQSLLDNTGLCRASYTEFSSCRAALLVILAESLNRPRSKNLRDALTRGMKLIRKMSGGCSTESEISLIESLEAAVCQLSLWQEGNDESSSGTEQGPKSAYAQFKSWTQAMKGADSTGSAVELSSFSPRSLMTPGSEGLYNTEMGNMLDLPHLEWTENGIPGFDGNLFSFPDD